MIDEHDLDEIRVKAKMMAMQYYLEYQLTKLGERAQLGGMGVEAQPAVPEAIPSGGMDNAVGLQS